MRSTGNPAQGVAVVLHGDAAALHLPDESVDLIVTSPPYFALRSYTDGGEAYGGQIGGEPTPGEYIDNLIACTREWTRVLKPTGSLWVNLGDKYNSAASGQQSTLAEWSATNARGGGHKPSKATPGRGSTVGGVPMKSLMGLPWRYALRCVDDLGLILRAEVIWSKPNGLPESVRDRVRRSHEVWFHMTRSARYFAAVDEIRTPHIDARLSKISRTGSDQLGSLSKAHTGRPDQAFNPLGALPGSVWTVATQPLKVPAELGVDHFAAFPMELPRRIILGWSPSGICTACGEGRRPVVERQRVGENRHSDALARRRSTLVGGEAQWRERMSNPDRITGEACACPDVTAPTNPSVVLDPFGGTGTTATVAKALGRVGITVDRSADYCRLARWRTSDPGQLERAIRSATDRDRFMCSECADRNEEPLTVR